MKTKVINFYGGPGSGKSTKAAGLYYKMNMAGFSVELNNEFAKECVWEDNVPMLKDQLFMLAHQHRKILRLVGKVDYVITDSEIETSMDCGFTGNEQGLVSYWNFNDDNENITFISIKRSNKILDT